MAEQKKEKKKLFTIRLILKWIGLAALSFLVVLALIFQAPWKLITLLLIILAACTVLPKTYRKWFWLSVAAIVLVMIIWVFLPEDNEGWRPYTFDDEFAALEAKYAIPDSENAAKMYIALHEDYDPNTMHPDSSDPNIVILTRREPWSSRDYPELAKWLEDQQNTIEKLIEASRIKNCRFPIVANIVDMIKQVFRFTAMRHWASLLVRAGNNDMAEGRIEEGLEKFLCVKRIGDHMQQQSSMIAIMSGIAVEDLALGPCKAFIVTADATEAHLSVIEKALADVKHDWTTDWPRILDYEKIILKNEFARYYDVNPRGKIRLSRDPSAEMRAWWMEQLEPEQNENQQIREYLESRLYLKYWQKKLIKARTILYWFCIPSSPQGAFKLIDTCFEKYYTMAEPEFDWQKESKKFSLTSPFSIFAGFNYYRLIEPFAYMSEELYYGFHDIYFRNTAEIQGVRIIIALRRYKNKTGDWPESLDDIKSLSPAEIFVDPINGDSFFYKLTEENFTLYSKGKNNIDEGGKHDKESGADDWLIWPPKTRKTKNEKADTQQSNTQKEVVK